MRILPSKQQWAAWSLPSKLTAIGAYVGIAGVAISLVSLLAARIKGSDVPIPSDISVAGDANVVNSNVGGNVIIDKRLTINNAPRQVDESLAPDVKPIASPAFSRPPFPLHQDCVVRNDDDREFVDIFGTTKERFFAVSRVDSFETLVACPLDARTKSSYIYFRDHPPSTGRGETSLLRQGNELHVIHATWMGSGGFLNLWIIRLGESLNPEVIYETPGGLPHGRFRIVGNELLVRTFIIRNSFDDYVDEEFQLTYNGHSYQAKTTDVRASQW